MDNIFIRRHVLRICSGRTRVELKEGTGKRTKSKVFYLTANTLEEEAIAGEIYEVALLDGLSEELYSDEELLDFLYSNSLWSEEEEKNLEKIPKDIEEFKVKIYKSGFRSNEKKTAKDAVRKAEKIYAELWTKRHSYDYLSAHGYAERVMNRYLAACRVEKEGKKSIWGRELSPDDFFMIREGVLDKILGLEGEVSLSESDLRYMSRQEPFASMFARTEGDYQKFFRGFSSPLLAGELTHEQESILSWGTLYSRIREHPEPPSDEVVEDDDMMDGWLIEQKRKRQAEQGSLGDLIKNDKIRNSEEVYIVCDTQEDAQKLDRFNSEQAKAIKKQRFNYIQQKGEVNEGDLPDRKLQRRMAIAKG